MKKARNQVGLIDKGQPSKINEDNSGHICLLILLSAGFVHLNPETIETLLQDVVTPEEQSEDIPLVGLQDEENWLVVIIEFPSYLQAQGRY